MSIGSAGCLVNLLFLVDFIMLAFELKSSKAASYALCGQGWKYATCQ